jgi:hypothetical protein
LRACRPVTVSKNWAMQYAMRRKSARVNYQLARIFILPMEHICLNNIEILSLHGIDGPASLIACIISRTDWLLTVCHSIVLFQTNITSAACNLSVDYRFCYPLSGHNVVGHVSFSLFSVSSVSMFWSLSKYSMKKCYYIIIIRHLSV